MPTIKIYLVPAVAENVGEKGCCREMGDSRKNLLAKRRKLRKSGSVSTNITAKYDGKIIFGIIAKRII